MKEHGPSEHDLKYSAPKETKGRFRSAVEKLARKLAIIGALAASGEQMAMAQEIHQADKHHVSQSEAEKAIKAREAQLNKWLEVFKMKNKMEVREAHYNEDPHEQLDLYVKAVKNAILDSGGLIGTAEGQEQASPAAEKFDEDMLRRYVAQFLQGHTDFKVVDQAKPGYKKEHAEKPQMHRETSGGINIEYSQEARQVMEQTGVRLLGTVLIFKDGNQIDLRHWDKVKLVSITAQGADGLAVTVHYGRNQELTERVTGGKFSGTFRGDKK